MSLKPSRRSPTATPGTTTGLSGGGRVPVGAGTPAGRGASLRVLLQGRMIQCNRLIIKDK